MAGKTLEEQRAGLTHRARIKALSFAIDAVRGAHLVACPRAAAECLCQYGEALRALKVMRREHFAAVEGEKRRAREAAPEGEGQ